MKNLLLVLLLNIVCTPAWATFSLRVGDPRFGWSTQQGTIEEAVLSIRPKGLYFEYGLYLTFSARSTTYKATDSLEVTLKFDLPAGAFVHDSWLWINNDIARAAIMDRWTASSIYEGIVNRRQDPSLLIKTSATQHELRVFPMRGDERRKVKITYLIPADWGLSTVSAELPISILKTSKNQLVNFHVLTWPKKEWQNPVIQGRPDLSFSVQADSVFGQYHATILTAANQANSLRFAFDSPLKNGEYLRLHGNGQSGIYQLAMLPARQFEYDSRRKILLLVDHDAGSSGLGTITAAAAMQALRTNFKQELTTVDSFNIIVSGLSPQMVSANWLPADPLSVEQAFNMAESLLSSYSNMPSLVAGGINWMKANGSDGLMLLATNSIQLGTTQAVNPLLNDLMAIQASPPIPVHVLHYHNSYSPSYFINGTHYYGSEYFLLNLAKLTGGELSRVLGNSLESATYSAVIGISATLQSYDVHTELANGYCYGRFDINTLNPDKLNLNRPILQIGKYQGDIPFKIQLAGELNGQFVSAEVALDASEIGLADSFTREMWYGNYIRLLEGSVQNNGTISEVVENSIDERVLSRYTAFLCLEDATQLCPTCQDETQLVETSEPIPADSLLRAWPNPFTDRVTIEVRATASATNMASSVLEIFSSDGQLVRQFRLGEALNLTTTLIWDGRDISGNSVPPGAYIAVARINPAQNAVLKLLKTE
ncbi:MAG: VIT domain-containing protein [Saprospiraceae bacterium]